MRYETATKFQVGERVIYRPVLDSSPIEILEVSKDISTRIEMQNVTMLFHSYAVPRFGGGVEWVSGVDLTLAVGMTWPL